ncbi:MAG: hypothetical protein O2973_07400 [Gemmatimonadetes bacterium]|nr:hypothetical protein [Gemmatimonadota bacterium]
MNQNQPARAIRAVCIAAMLVLTVATCSSADRITSPGTELTVGTWGGDMAGAIVNDTIAHIHIGCTFGDLPGPIALNADGRFTVDGNYTLRAFPVVLGPSLPAQFSGVVHGKTLTFAVAKLSARMFRMIDSLKTYAPTDADVTKVKETIIRGRETTTRTNGYWASNIASRDRNGEDIGGLLGAYDEMATGLTAKQIQDAAKLYFNLQRYVKVMLLPAAPTP